MQTRLRAKNVTCHTRLHSVTCHPTQLSMPLPPCLNPSQPGWYSIYLPRRDRRLSWPGYMIIYQDGLPVCRVTLDPTYSQYFPHILVNSQIFCQHLSIFRTFPDFPEVSIAWNRTFTGQRMPLQSPKLHHQATEAMSTLCSTGYSMYMNIFIISIMSEIDTDR